MSAITPETLISHLEWRYATKRFDPGKKIPDATWTALEDSLVLAPSSFGLQPFKFIVVTDPSLKEKLRPACWDQPQLTECSHVVVFARRQRTTEADIDLFVARMAEVRGVAKESLAGYRGFMTGTLVGGPLEPIADAWAARQAYIALGAFLTSAALLGVDTCPMEGFVPEKVDEVLGLTGTGFGSVVIATAGYRSAEDKYASLAKVRFPKETLIDRR
jgi:nitroreductase